MMTDDEQRVLQQHRAKHLSSVKADWVPEPVGEDQSPRQADAVHVELLATPKGIERVTRIRGVTRRAAAGTPPSLDYTVPMPQPQQWDFSHKEVSYADVTDMKPPHYLSRTQLGFWWSAAGVLRSGPATFWLITAINRVPDSWFGNMHRSMMSHMRDAARAGKLRSDWGGVRVFEPHPGGHGLHAHWLMKGRMPHKVVQACATRAGLGLVWVRSQECDVGAIHYLVKYMGKQAKEMSGVRRWSCIGNYDGVKKNEIVFSGTRIDKVKQMMVYYQGQGHKQWTAYRMAEQYVKEEELDFLHGPRDNAYKKPGEDIIRLTNTP